MQQVVTVSREKAVCGATVCMNRKYDPQSRDFDRIPFVDGQRVLLAGDKDGFILYHHTTEVWGEGQAGKATWVTLHVID